MRKNRAMNLPNAHQAIVERRKVTDYLLAIEHPEGGGKQGNRIKLRAA